MDIAIVHIPVSCNWTSGEGGNMLSKEFEKQKKILYNNKLHIKNN